jgi:hypothetical protein
VLVTGCPRSGTRYITLVLRRLGLDVGHERIGRDGVSSWALAVDAERTPWGPSWGDVQFDTVLHQVRHPLDVIDSVETLKPTSWEFVSRHVPLAPRESFPVRGALLWCHWNRAAERRATLTYRVEAIGEALPLICEALDVPHDPGAATQIPTDVNTRKLGRAFHLAEESLHRSGVDPGDRLRGVLARRRAGTPRHLTWAQLHESDPSLCERVRELATAYGYVE